MAPPDPAALAAVMPQTIARFMQLSQEQALHEKINSLQETVATLREHYDQEIKALQAITSAQKDRHEAETTALREVITNLQNRHSKYDEEISSLQKEVTHLRTFPREQDRALGQPHPRGVKRERADDEARRHKGKRQSLVDAASRQQDFVDYVITMRDEFNKTDNYGRDQRAFICRFIDGIQDPVLSRWFQESLKARFPDRVHDEKRSARKAGGGGRIVGPTRDLTWKDVETVLKHTLWPSMDG
ncbi:hypothetical protein INS49_010170 [Diaporthe citri]|uniref:uncharacterized protein n=1 Tax=Diaporthe citri TaxID=83186 RepID=UPI001C7EA353|nr:uncharacterized protein INS49_010170 [Diaporthe citri]KAG6361941.1 hypothetical protein INS49_010170 [Diaporthe citri]